MTFQKAYADSMGSKTITFEAPEDLIATVDQVATYRSVDRAVVVRDALAEYFADYLELQADLEESEREIAAGETIAHEKVVAWFRSKYPALDKSEAA